MRCHRRLLVTIIVFCAIVLTHKLSAQSLDSETGWAVDTVQVHGKDLTVAASAYVSAVGSSFARFPEARVIVDCDSVWLDFTFYPDLNRRAFSEPIRYMVDNVIDWPSGVTAHYRNTWDTRNHIQFGQDRTLIAKLKSGSVLKMALPWYGGGHAAYVWQLKGSSAAIAKSCGQ